MKSTNVKAMVAKVMTVGLLAGAFVMAGSLKAEAQEFGVGIQIGYPHYDYSHRDYYEHERFERERREAFARQQAFERQQAFARQEAWEHHSHDWDRDRDDNFRGDRDDFRGR